LRVDMPLTACSSEMAEALPDEGERILLLETR
jgi:hypothetical protein